MKSKTVKQICRIVAKQELTNNPLVDLSDVDPIPAISTYIKEQGFVGLTDGEICKCMLPDIMPCGIISISCATFGKQGVGSNYAIKKKIISDFEMKGESFVLEKDYEKSELDCLISACRVKVHKRKNGYLLVVQK